LMAQLPSAGNAAWYALYVLGLCAFNLFGLLLLLPHGLMARKVLGPWAVAAATALVPLLPLAYLGYRQRGQISWIPRAGVRVLISSPDTIFVAGVAAGAVIALALLAFSRRWEALLLVAG